MTKHQSSVFVLWGDDFEAVPATILVTELRKAGLRVKVVGLHPHNICGTYGLALVPDLTLDQALPLAEQITCLIIPQRAEGLQSLTNDPRLHQLCELAHTNQAKFVIGSRGAVDIPALQLFPASAVAQLMVYQEGEGVMAFARTLGEALLENDL